MTGLEGEWGLGRGGLGSVGGVVAGEEGRMVSGGPLLCVLLLRLLLLLRRLLGVLARDAQHRRSHVGGVAEQQTEGKQLKGR